MLPGGSVAPAMHMATNLVKQDNQRLEIGDV
jgi:hypothetical protein